MKVKNVKTDRLKPYPGNPRDNDKAVAAVAKSIREYGFNSPIVTDPNYVVICGHTRLKAALKLGLAEVPVLVVRLSESQAREYRIADNKTSEFSDWSTSDLVAELRELGDMSEFFPSLDVNALLAETAGAANYVPPAQKDIDDVKKRLEKHYLDKSSEAQERYAEITCPDCGGIFYLDRREAMKVAMRKEGE